MVKVWSMARVILSGSEENICISINEAQLKGRARVQNEVLASVINSLKATELSSGGPAPITK